MFLRKVIFSNLFSAVKFVVRGKILRITQGSVGPWNNGKLGKKNVKLVGLPLTGQRTTYNNE